MIDITNPEASYSLGDLFPYTKSYYRERGSSQSMHGSLLQTLTIPKSTQAISAQQEAYDKHAAVINATIAKLNTPTIKDKENKVISSPEFLAAVQDLAKVLFS